MAINFTGLDRLAGQASASIEGARQNRAQQQANELRNQRILQQQQFEAGLRQKGIDAQNERESKQLAQRKQFHLDDLEFKREQLGVDKNRNAALRDKNKIDRRALDLTRGAQVADTIFGGRERSLSAQRKIIQEQIFADPSFRAQGELQLKVVDAQMQGIMRDRSTFLQGFMGQVDPTFQVPSLPEAPLPPPRTELLGVGRGEHRGTPRENTTAERAAADRAVVPDQKGRPSNSINPEFTITGDSSKMSLQKDTSTAEKKSFNKTQARSFTKRYMQSRGLADNMQTQIPIEDQIRDIQKSRGDVSERELTRLLDRINKISTGKKEIISTGNSKTRESLEDIFR